MRLDHPGQIGGPGEGEGGEGGVSGSVKGASGNMRLGMYRDALLGFGTPDSCDLDMLVGSGWMGEKQE